MSGNIINILVTFDKNYIPPFRTMLKSLIAGNPRETVSVWLLHSSIPDDELLSLKEYCESHGTVLNAIRIDRTIFQNAPISKRYPQEMYYRLLAPLLLPENLERILYLDPDILVLNPIRPLFETSLDGLAFAAASHLGVTDIMNSINKKRLKTDHDYYNTGVVLMDLAKARSVIRPDEIYQCVKEHEAELLLPDQDVFNYLYGAYTLPVDDAVWNYDARSYPGYMIRSGGEYDMDWVMKNTAFLHFCGKRKPWSRSYSHRFAALYKHYMRLAEI